LDGLKAQSVPKSEWELLIIDNKSDVPLSTTVDLSWHPNARIVVEPVLGIASARIRALQEFKGDLLIFLDDDNIMAENYLQCCLDLFATRQDLGAASGCLMPEYEAQPPDWFGPYESWIAVRRITQSTWSNFHDTRSEPVTAGMCLRREVAEAFVSSTVKNPKQRILGSRGTSLMRGEDVALAKMPLALGYSVGQFAHLKMIHLIPKRRVSPDYLFSLYRHLCASGHLVGWVDNMGRGPIRLSWRTVLKSAIQFVKGGQIRRRLVIEEFRGYYLARKLANEWVDEDKNPAAPERNGHG
jgi:glycosyltransferase involved in cell wall biosynthesis